MIHQDKFILDDKISKINYPKIRLFESIYQISLNNRHFTILYYII